jgi:hypothetical protein
MKQCDKGWTDGSCCCNCIHQKIVMRHPQNQLIGKGQISEVLGWLCTYQHMDGSNKDQFIFFEDKHGMCETYFKKQ